MGLVKHFHHQPNISGASSVNTIVKVCSNTAQPQKYLYFLMREERVLLHLVQLLKYIYIKKKLNPEIFASFLTEKVQNQLTDKGEHMPEHQPFHFLQSAYTVKQGC